MTALCTCHRCDYELRRIRSDVGDVKERARMTEPERRRAAGETPFRDGAPAVSLANALLGLAVEGHWAGVTPGILALESIAALLRAIVLQELVECIVAWCEAEVLP
jgi:hypothetical protein